VYRDSLDCIKRPTTRMKKSNVSRCRFLQYYWKRNFVFVFDNRVKRKSEALMYCKLPITFITMILSLTTQPGSGTVKKVSNQICSSSRNLTGTTTNTHKLTKLAKLVIHISNCIYDVPCSVLVKHELFIQLFITFLSFS